MCCFKVDFVCIHQVYNPDITTPREKRLVVVFTCLLEQTLGLHCLQTLKNWRGLLCQRRQWQPTPVLLPEKFYGRRSLVGCSSWDRAEESDTAERVHFHALEKEVATHSSVLAWRIPGIGEPGGLPSMGSHRVGHD